MSRCLQKVGLVMTEKAKILAGAAQQLLICRGMRMVAGGAVSCCSRAVDILIVQAVVIVLTVAKPWLRLCGFANGTGSMTDAAFS